MPSNNPRGLVPLRTLRGDSNWNSRRYHVSANNPTRLFKGDPVKLVDGNVRLIATSGHSAGDRGVLGVISALYNSNGRPLTHNLPDSGQFIAASAEAYVDVITDPDVTYLANADATVAEANIGLFTRVTAGSANTAAGISGFSVRIADATTANVASHQFMIVGVGPNDELDGLGNNVYDGTFPDVEVMISDHQFKRKNRVVGTTGVSGASD